MSYSQVIAPDLNTLGNVGWCLAFVEKAYNDTNYSYATAHDGWQACEFIHQDRNLPPNVMVPIWFDYYESGINYGHVAINVPSRGVLSSPYKADNTQQWFTDINQCATVLNCTYLGWSEDLMGVRVIKGVSMTEKQAEETLKYMYLLASGVDPNPGQISYWLPRVRDTDSGVIELGSALLANKPASTPPASTILTPGNYTVK